MKTKILVFCFVFLLILTSVSFVNAQSFSNPKKSQISPNIILDNESNVSIANLSVYIEGELTWKDGIQIFTPSIQQGENFEIKVTLLSYDYISNADVYAGYFIDGRSIEDRTSEFDIYPNNTYTKTLYLEVPSNASQGDYTLNVKVEANQSIGGFSDNNVTFHIGQVYCINGPQGSKLKLVVNNPDNGDDFYPGDNISVDVNVANRGNDSIDFVIETQLYDITTDEELDSSSFDDTLDEGDDNDYSLYLKVPTDIDQSDEYAVNVKVYEDGNEVEQCKENSINIDIKRKSHQLKIDKIVIDSPVKPGNSLQGDIKISNIGTHDESGIMLEVTCETLGIYYLGYVNDLDEGDTEWATFSIEIPSNAQDGIYPLNVRVYNDNVNETGNSSFIVDSVKPIAYFGLNPRDGLITGAQRITFDAKCSDIHGLSNLKIYGSWYGWGAKAYVDKPLNNTFYHITIGNIPYGNWKWAVFCEDKAGNTAFTNTNRTLIIRPPLTPINAVAS